MFKEFFVNKKLIIFDLDGTAIDSTIVWHNALLHVMKIAGIEGTNTGPTGVSIREKWLAILKNVPVKTEKSLEELAELTQTEFLNKLSEVEITDGFWPFVHKLKFEKEMKLALVSNTPRFVVDKVLAYFDMTTVFDSVICGDEVKHPKPNPEIYNKMLKNFKLSPKQALAFEDSLAGAISADSAGIQTIVVWDEETYRGEFPNKVLDFTLDFTPFPKDMDTTKYEDILQLAKEQEQANQAG